MHVGLRTCVLVLTISILLYGLLILPYSAAEQASAPATDFLATTSVLTSKWNKTDPRGGLSGVLIADVNGDGSEDVIFAGGNLTPSASAPGYVTARSGIDGSLIWQHSDSSIGFWVQPQMADVNKDGILEVLVPLQAPAGLLILNSRNGAQLARRSSLGGVSFSSPVSCDIDGDGYQEIFFCSTDTVYGNLSGWGRVRSLRYDKTALGNLSLLHSTFAWRPCSGGLSVADTDFDGEFELYMGDRYMYKEDGGYGKGVRSFWARNLTERWNRPEVHCSSNIPMLADVNGDGILDVISGYMNGGVYVLNSTDGRVIKQKVSGSSQLPVHYQPSIYDIDRDGHLEMLMADGEHSVPSLGTSSNDTVIFDLVTMTIDKRLTSTGRCFYGPQVADVTGDGVMDIIACNYSGCVLVFNRSYSLVARITNLRGILNYAVVQDIDKDGYNEVVVSTQSGRIYAFDTPARTPVPRPRSEIQFYSERRLGAAEYVASPGCVEPVVTSVSPSNLQKNVPVSTSKLSFTLTDYQRNLMNYTVTTNPSVGSKSGSNVGNGRVEVSISGLQYHTTYAWTVKVTDGSHWTNKTYRFTTELFVPGSQAPIPQVPEVYAPSPADDAVGVPTSLAHLSFNLVDLQGRRMNYSVSTYPNIGSGSGINVPSGRYNVDVSGIVRSTTYTWNITVTIGTYSDKYSFKFTSGLGNQPAQGTPNLASQPAGKPPLICYNQTTSDSDGDKVTNIYNWYRNNVSITNLLFSFDTNTSGSVKDYSGYGNRGTIVGNVKWTPNGRVGGAYTFDKGYITVLDGGLLDGRGLWTEMTIEFWVYATASQSGTRVIAKIPSYEIGFTSSNKIFAGIWTDKLDGYTRVTSASSLTLNVWYHVALTYKSGVGMKLYINGAQAASAYATGNIKPCSASEPLYIGWFDYFKGKIDEVRIYPRSLTSNQVKQRYNDTKGGLSNSSTIVAGETKTGESWRCAVTPNDSYQDGQTKSSNTVMIR